MIKKAVYLGILLLICSSCGEYYKVQKSTDLDLKYQYAKKCFDTGKYNRAYSLLEDLVAAFKGTDKGEESLYLLALSHFMAKNYDTAGDYFATYYRSFPKGEYTEMARYYSGLSYYNDSPDPRLDQSITYKGIEELQMYLDYYPRGEKVKEAQDMIVKLQEKLVEKEFLNAMTYFNIGNYLGRNYFESAVITAQNALKTFPYTQRKEEFLMLILRARYKEAQESINERKGERYRNTIDEYYAYINEYPDGKYKKEAESIFNDASKYIDSEE